MSAHRLAEERSLALHREIAGILARHPERVERARERVRRWREDRSVAAYYADEWARLLAGPLDALQRVLVDSGEHARALRQVTPFAGFVDARTRWRIWRDTRARMNGDR